MEKVLIFAVASLFGFMLRRQSETVRGWIGDMAIVECLIVSLLPADANHWQAPPATRCPIPRMGAQPTAGLVDTDDSTANMQN